MSFFGLIFCLSLAAIPHVSIGLDQQLALPTDSYMGKYFTFMSNYLEVRISGRGVSGVAEH